MAPKTNCNTLKLDAVVTYLQNSLSCHTLKDLEKQLPAATSISGMQVKDYLQALHDDNRIRVEKIGSGNWYWCFASDEKIKAEDDLTHAQLAHSKLVASVTDLRNKVIEIAAQREDEEDMEESRADVMVRKTIVEADVQSLKKELEAYREDDPTELERKKREIDVWKLEAEHITDDIYAMEGWFKNQAPEAMDILRVEYGDEWDDEENDFRMLE